MIPVPGIYFMESVNDHRMASGSTYTMQISGAEAEQTLSIQLRDALDQPFSCNGFHANQGEVVLDGAPGCHR